jgi:hypothetical protein
MDLAKRIALLAPFLALLACGGSTTQLGGGGGGDGGPNPSCPSATVVGSGGACNDPGESCTGTVTLPYGCGEGSGTTTTQCTCQDGNWQCPVAFAGGACPATCPDPSQVAPGGTCTTNPSLSCTSSFSITDCNGQPVGSISCDCPNGEWECEPIGTPVCPVPPEAGTCPPAGQVFVGDGCDTYGTTCSGDPQTCGSTTVYDTLQCNAGQWTLVAQTFCDEADAGFIDAEGPDAGQGI